MKILKFLLKLVVVLLVVSLCISYINIDYKNISKIKDEKFKSSFKEVLKELNWEENDVKNIVDEGDWMMGKYYSFFYHGSRYYISTYDTGDIYSISLEKNPESSSSYVYINDNIHITDSDNNDVITLQWNAPGKYGKYDLYDGEKYLRFYVPEGVYYVKALNKNSTLFIEKKKIYKNSSGYDESETVKKVVLKNIDDVEEITVKSDECLSLVNNSYVSLNIK